MPLGENEFKLRFKNQKKGAYYFDSSHWVAMGHCKKCNVKDQCVDFEKSVAEW